MFQVPDPVWKQNPDIVAEESFGALYNDVDDDDLYAIYDPDWSDQ